MKKLLITTLIFLGLVGQALAAPPNYTYSRTILPEQNLQSELGSSTPAKAWYRIFSGGFFDVNESDGCANFVSGEITSTGIACGTGSGGGGSGESVLTRNPVTGLIYNGTTTDDIKFGPTANSTTTRAKLEVGFSLAANGSIAALGSTTLQNFTFKLATGTSATTTNFFATTASTTAFFGAGLPGVGCTGTNALTWSNGAFSCTAQAQGTVTSVSGTASRISSTGGATPVIDIDAAYVGQASITTLGTITTGVWTGTAIANANLANSTISGKALGTNLDDLTATNGTLTFSGAYNGGTARTVGLNLASANLWTASTTFAGGLSSINSTSTNATSTNFFATTASSTNFFGAGLSGGSGCAGSTFLQYDGAGKFSCGTPAGGSGGGNSKWATTTNGVAIYPNGGATTGLVIGGVATTTGTNFQIIPQAGIMPLSIGDGVNPSYFEVERLGNIGVGTSTSNWSLQVASSTPYLAITDTNAPLNLKHWLISNRDGTLVLGNGNDALTSTTTAVTITSAGNASTTALSSTAGSFFATASGQVTIGTGAPAIVGSSVAKLTVQNTAGSAIANFVSTDAQQGVLSVRTNGASTFMTPIFRGTRSHGTNASPSAVQVNDGIFSLAGCGFIDGTTDTCSAFIDMAAESNWTALTNSPSYIGFSTTNVGATNGNSTERLRINSMGNIGIGTTTPNWLLQVASTTPFIAITDTDSTLNKKHWLISAVDGIFRIGTSTDTFTATSTVFGLKNGHEFSSTTAPTLSSGVVDGTDSYGNVTGCSSACTVTFAAPYERRPTCVVTPETGSVANTFSYTVSATAIVVTETGLGVFDYMCKGQ